METDCGNELMMVIYGKQLRAGFPKEKDKVGDGKQYGGEQGRLK